MCNDHRRCPGANCPEARAAHNARRRHNRKLKDGAVRYARHVLHDDQLAAQLAGMNPKEAKDWIAKQGLGTSAVGTSPGRRFLAVGESPEGGEEGSSVRPVVEGKVIPPGPRRERMVLESEPAPHVAGPRPGGAAGRGVVNGRKGPGGVEGDLRRHIVEKMGTDVAAGLLAAAEALGRQEREQMQAQLQAERERVKHERDRADRLLQDKVRAEREQARRWDWRSSPEVMGQVAHQLSHQGGPVVERMLLDSEVREVKPLDVLGGVNTTRRIDLGHGMMAYHKPMDETDVGCERGFGHGRPGQQQVHEAAAWRLAEQMGKPYDELVAPCVMREVDGQMGSLSLERPGRTMGDPARIMREAPKAIRAAGLFDALVRQQDRHMGNYLYDSTHRQLTLIDHGFSFSKSEDRSNASYLQSARYMSANQLDDEERAVLRRLLDSKDTFGMKGLLEPERVEALRERAQRMLDSGRVLSPGA